jgi:malate:Na+ symporter
MTLRERAMGWKLGAMPVPVFVVAVVVVCLAAYHHRLPNDLIGGLAVMMLGGLLLDQIGHKIPVLSRIGGPAILCLFVPAALVGYGLFQPDMLAAIKSAMKVDNLLYLYIASLVVGSIMGIDHRVLGIGFLRVWVPLIVGTAVAVTAGMAAGALLGYELGHTFFFIIIPILSGGVGEGILPLSVGYAAITGRPQAELVATMIPAAMIGNVVAILAAGLLGQFGERYPAFSGKGQLVKMADGHDAPAENHHEPYDLALMGAGLLLVCSFYTLGELLAPLTGISGPVMMIIAVAAVKLLRIMPAPMELGAYQFYKFVALNLTPAILVGLGAIYISWDQLLLALTPGYFIVCAVTVVAMVTTGFVTGFIMRLHPVEAAIVSACHSGLGGTGDVAILSASNRMNLMPFSQMVTRVGGAGMVVLATLLMHHFG